MVTRLVPIIGMRARVLAKGIPNVLLDPGIPFVFKMSELMEIDSFSFESICHHLLLPIFKFQNRFIL